MLLGGVVISGVAAAADMTAAGKAVADYQRGGATGSELTANLSLGLAGVAPGPLGVAADVSSLGNDLLPGFYVGP